jgi:hypothetical protein
MKKKRERIDGRIETRPVYGGGRKLQRKIKKVKDSWLNYWCSSRRNNKRAGQINTEE